jgi:hypothetical protein
LRASVVTFLGKGREMLCLFGGRFELLAHVRGVLGVRGAHLDKFTTTFSRMALSFLKVEFRQVVGDLVIPKLEDPDSCYVRRHWDIHCKNVR